MKIRCAQHGDIMRKRNPFNTHVSRYAWYEETLSEIASAVSVSVSDIHTQQIRNTLVH
jgi:hypothetical protein